MFLGEIIFISGIGLAGKNHLFDLKKKDIYHICWLKLSVQMFQLLILIYKRVVLCVIIGDVHKFIGNCLIPLDPSSQLPALILKIK